MARKTIPIEKYIEVAQVFHWAAIEHFILWFIGMLERHRRTESVLRKLVQKGNLRSVKFGKRLVYTVPRRTKGKQPVLTNEKKSYEPGSSEAAIAGRNKIIHGLACTEALVRFWRSSMDGEIIAERFFYKCGAVPEWGIRYSNGKMLLFEFCTKSNFEFSNNVKGKLNAYLKYLQEIERKFERSAIVLFVIDIPREKVERFVGSLRGDVGSDGGVPPSPDGDRFPLTPFFFTDYQTFLKVPMGKQLTEPIYLWSYDGKEYPLRKV